jgi:hypothetical protein
MRKLLFLLLILHTALSLSGQVVKPVGDYVTDRFVDSTGREVIKIIVPGRPPDHFRMPAVSPPRAATSLANVPAYDWSFGCSATSAAMMAGYYDRTNYPNMYAGPTNGGVAPMNNSAWGTVVINGNTLSQCPFSATRQGLDGRTSRGHVDDYWITYNNAGPDPFIANGWTEHTYGECTGDYMKTNQSTYGNIDGGTTFWYYTDGSPFTGNYGNNDGMYGIKLFFESRGYTVTSSFNQYIYGFNGNTLGFTFDQYKQQIDAGRPVLIQVSGHTMLGMGYNDTGSLIYLHDTWDYSTHEMTWGGSYAGMAQYGVGVIQLQPAVPQNRTLQNITVANGQSVCYDATQTIAVAGSGTTFIVQSGGDATLIAGQNILFLPGSLLQSGSHVLATITTNGNYCSSMQSAMVRGENVETGKLVKR